MIARTQPNARSTNMQDHDHIGSNTTFRDGWIAGAARAFFVLAYADYVEEGDSTDNDLTDDERSSRSSMPRPGVGGDWYGYAPETPPNAYALAGELWAMLESENGCSVYALAKRAAEADGTDHDDGEGGVDSEEFGRDLAMQAMGTGVSWFDDHKRFDLKVPHLECGEFTFDVNAYAESECIVDETPASAADATGYGEE